VQGEARVLEPSQGIPAPASASCWFVPGSEQPLQGVLISANRVKLVSAPLVLHRVGEGASRSILQRFEAAVHSPGSHWHRNAELIAQILHEAM